MSARGTVLKLMGLVLASLLLAGCATTGQVQSNSSPSPADPWENWNRRVFAFNDGLDIHVLQPIAQGYVKVVPQVMRQGVGNFFGNVSDAWSAVNNVLQGKWVPAYEDTVRFTTNSVLGIFGLLDIASEMGIERHNEDFGQTLGVWGLGTGPYVVWPLLGPSSVRDTLALPLDRMATPGSAFTEDAVKWGLTSLNVVNTRANFLGAGQLLDGIALDKYTFLRDAYLQRRRSLVFDGEPPDAVEAQEPAPVAAPAP
jgi:phospholipid-binding lipoprotein MlaA